MTQTSKISPNIIQYCQHVVIFILFLTVNGNIFAQSQFSKQSEQQGLLSKLIKCINIDHNSVVYVATDNGMFIKRSKQYVQVPNPPNCSKYYKSIFTSSNGKVYAASDNSISEIVTTHSSVTLDPIVININHDPTLPNYSKSFYEDQHNTIWISGSSHLYAMKDRTIKSYLFSKENASASFEVSYQLFELGPKLFALSQTGSLFQYNAENDTFDLLKKNLSYVISCVKVLSPNKVIVGTNSGIIELVFNNSYKLIKQIHFDFHVSVSTFSTLTEGVVYTGTWEDGLFLYDTNKHTMTCVDDFPGYNINNICSLPNHSFLFSTDNGLIEQTSDLYTKHLDISSSGGVLGMLAVSDSFFFISSYKALYIIDQKNNFKSTKIKLPHNIRGGSLSMINDEIWMAGYDGSISRFNKNGTLIGNKIILKQGLNNIVCDNDQTIWFSSGATVYQMRNDNMKSYHLNVNTVNSLFVDSNNKLFVGCLTSGLKLFEYERKTDRFNPINYKRSFAPEHQMISVHSFQEVDNCLYIATSNGLLYLKDNQLSRLAYGEFEQEEVTNFLVIPKNDEIWLTNSYGLFCLHQNTLHHYPDERGLTSKSFARIPLIADADNNIWLGTSNAVFTVKGMQQIKQTQKPFLYFEKTSHSQLMENNTLFCQINKPLYIDVLNPIFPLNGNTHQYRLLHKGETKTQWHTFQLGKPVSLSNIKAGTYKLEVKTLQGGSFNWSKSSSIPLEIHRVWYFRKYTIFLFFLIALGLITFWIKRYKRNLHVEKIQLEEHVKQRTENLSQVISRLGRMNTTKDRFLSIISHDLKNPIGAISAMSKIILENNSENLTSTQRDSIAIIKTSADQSYELLVDLLEWSRSQSGKLKFNPETHSIKDISLHCLALLMGQAKAKNITLINDIDNNAVFVDHSMIETVLRNLVSNSLKFSFRDSTIRLHSFKEGKLLRISVTDYGKGIEQDLQKKMFKMDELFSTKGTEGEAGSGLGLVLCKEFVKRNGGNISVNSIPNQETTISFTVPISMKKIEEV